MVRRYLIWCLTAVIVLYAGRVLGTEQQPQSAGSSDVASPIQATINQYCVSCHNEKTKTGGLALDSADILHPDTHPEIWEKVIRKLNGRMMPPAGRPRPETAAYNAVVSYLQTALDGAAGPKPNPGRTDTFRLLTRREYQNAIRDVLSVEIDATALLPKDESSHGFDNTTIAGLPPALVERYLSAAEKISRLAIGSPLPFPDSYTVKIPPDLTQDEPFEDLPFGTRGGTVVKYAFPQDGQYDIQVRLQRDRHENIEGLSLTNQMEITLDGERVKLFTLKTPDGYTRDYYADGTYDLDFNVRLPIKAGPHAVAVTFLKRPATLIETERQPYETHYNYDRHPRIGPAVFTVAINGPFGSVNAGRTPSRDRIFVCRPNAASDEDACARTILLTLARRAYRRPVTAADIQIPFSFYKEARSSGDFDTGIEMALRRILISPEFLFRIERDPEKSAPNTAYRISDVELASRLSFFLWSSIPDDELLDLAIRGKLQDPAVLEQQVRRMLADSRSQSLMDNFAQQWLYLRNLADAFPDPRAFLDFDDNLRQAFARETELFFESMIREDRSVLDLLTADYTFLNERLAKHYGISNVHGSQFRRVTLDAGSMRGGLLGQASVLTVTSYATRTSPVLRGKWVLENILGTPPPPPPPNVPALEEPKKGEKVLSMRDRMAQHRSNAVCSSCHQLMDPVGLAFENFDAIGRWRNRTEDGVPVNASGALPDGIPFEGVAGLKKAVLSRPEMFVNTVVEKLLTYALGRGTEYYDAPTVRAILRDNRETEYRFSSLILSIVKSAPFKMRRSL